jgi:hypothetical protein
MHDAAAAGSTSRTRRGVAPRAFRFWGAQIINQSLCLLTDYVKTQSPGQHASMATIAANLIALSKRPLRGTAEYAAWLAPQSALDVLSANARSKHLIVYASLSAAFIHSAFVPTRLLKKADAGDLLGWNGNAYSSWGVCSTFGHRPTIRFEQPLNGIGSKTIARGEQLIFARDFSGRTEQPQYFELLQKFVHVSGIHYVHERNAYCRIDARGDIEDVVTFSNYTDDEHVSGTIISIDRALLDQYAALTDQTLLCMFDFMQFNVNNFNGWHNDSEEHVTNTPPLIYRHRIQSNDASFTRGVHIISTRRSKADAYRLFNSLEEEEPKQYASFIALDAKNKRIGEISCAPEALCNYFTKSDLPFEVTPAFFRPEVLLKYKADSDKYKLEQRSISCRDTWHLQTYDINEQGQVHTYLIYLSQLPYDEQLYWKSFNEYPKGTISKRAFQSDILGEFADIDDPLNELKHQLRKFEQSTATWWRAKADDLYARLHYPVANSADEWAESIMSLDKLVVEGLEEKWMRNRLTELGKAPPPQWRSLKLLEHWLIALGFEADHAAEIVSPLHEVHNLRSQTKGHATGSGAKKIRADAIREHGTYRTHFEHLCVECLESLRTVNSAASNPPEVKSPTAA